ncbi:zinc finger MYM-type protein 3-like [Ciona intestinalis]
MESQAVTDTDMDLYCKAKSYVCSTCEVTFSRYESHLKLNHTDVDKVFCCIQCKDIYTRSYNLITCYHCNSIVKNTKVAVSQISGGGIKVFCCGNCMLQHSNEVSEPIVELSCQMCCNPNEPIILNVLYNGRTHKLCSNSACLVKFKKLYKLELHSCVGCNDQLFDGNGQQFIQHQGKIKEFCSTECLNLYKGNNKKHSTCSWCKTTLNVFSMIERVGSDNKLTYFCSLSCMSKHMVKLEDNYDILCSYCNMEYMVKFYVVMSDASIKGFCSIDCVANYEKKFKFMSIKKTCNSDNGRGSTKQKGSDADHQLSECTYSGSKYVCISSTLPSLTHPSAFIKQFGNPGRHTKLVKATRIMPAASLCVPVELLPESVEKVKQYFEDHKLIGAETQTSHLLSVTDLKKKNKAVMCKPYKQNKLIQTGDVIKTCDASTQTHGEWLPTLFPIPIPVPIYVPCPVKMFSEYVPHPVPLPIPIPVPVLLPTTMSNVDSLINSIDEIRQKFPNNPIEADLLLMAEAVSDGDDERCRNMMEGEAEDVLSIAANITGIVDVTELNVEDDIPSLVDEPSAKRRKKSTSTVSNIPFHFKYGITAWKRWVFNYNRTSQAGRIPVNLTSLSQFEIKQALVKFVRSVKRPDGQPYRADSIFYLLMGIQEDLSRSGRLDNIFTDHNYAAVMDAFHSTARSWIPVCSPLRVDTRICEEQLWQCKQLGAHSPHSLLFTMLYFTTKGFLLKTAEEHNNLTLLKVMQRSKCIVRKSNVLTVSSCVKHGKDSSLFDRALSQNKNNPMRCPAGLFAFYFSKCPSVLRSNSSELFYLRPEQACIPESPVWYSPSPLSTKDIELMLFRILMVKEVHEFWINNTR